MVPVFEKGSGQGIEYRLEDFLTRFREISEEHLRRGRAKSFAFIFYDRELSLHRVLKEKGVFTKLDRLSGDRLSIFYLDDAKEGPLRAFNEGFLALLGVSAVARPPCMIFYRFEDGAIREPEVANLSSDDLIHAFQELYEVVREFLNRKPPRRSRRWVERISGALRLVSEESVKTFIKVYVESVLK